MTAALSLRLALALLSLTVGCGARTLPPDAYRAWVESKDCPLRATFQSGGVSWSALCKPTDYVALLEAGPDAAAFDSIRALFLPQQHFSLRVTQEGETGDLLKSGTEDPSEFSARLAYCMSRMQDDVHLEEGGVRLPCRMFHFVRTHGLAPGLSFVMSFDRLEDEQKALRSGASFRPRDKTLVIDDGLFGAGKIHLVISGSALTDAPRLKL